jgi:hypothetical protein
MAFNCYRGMRTSEAVLTTVALRLFPVSYARGVTTDLRMARDGTAFQERLAAIDEGDLAGQSSAVMLSDLVSATFAPMIGGHWWRLRLNTADGSTSIRGNGPGTEIAVDLAEHFGDRLHQPWAHRPRVLLLVRNVIGFAGLGLSSFALILAVWFLVAPPTGATRVEGLIVLAGGAVCLLVGMLPDLLARAWDATSPSSRATRELVTGPSAFD